MNNLIDEKALYIKSGLFSTSVPGNTFSAMPHNHWMKMTVNRGSKIKCGWIGIFNNEFTPQINTKVMKNIKTAKESLKSFSNIKNHQFKHIECSSAQMIKDAKAFERRINVFHE